MGKKWYLIWALHSIAMVTWGQVAFQCSVDSNKMLIGDQRILSLTIEKSSQVNLDTILWQSWLENSFELLDDMAWSANQPTYAETQLKFTVFDTGYIQLPPLPIVYRTGEKSDTAYSNDLVLEVFPVAIDTTGLAPIKTIIKEPLAFVDFIPYLGGVLLASALFLIVYFLRKKKVPEEKIVEIPIPAHEIALKELGTLRSKKLWQQGKIKAYQSELTYIIRAYLENRFNILALESTTSEILKDITDKGLSPDLVQSLDEILNVADLVKFAKAQPDISIHQTFMDKAENFIIETKEKIITANQLENDVE